MGDEEVKCICKFCGKSFKNMRALCGHKRSHSGKELKTYGGLHWYKRVLTKRKSGRCSSKMFLKLPNNLPREKRSVRRYKINTCSINYSFYANSSNYKYGNGNASSVSIADEDELKEIACCLLMLSKGGFYSGNNVSDVSVVSETRTEHCEVRVGPSCHDSDHINTTKYVSVDGIAELLGLNSDVCKISKEHVEYGPNFDFQGDSEFYVTKLKDENIGIAQLGSVFENFLDSMTCDHTLEETKCGFANVSDSAPAYDSELKHVCKNCGKGFRSGQVLGGHLLHCGRSKRSYASEADLHAVTLASQKIGFESVELGDDYGKKRARRFICSVCCKEFCSGQALGGHMRAHFQGHPQTSEKYNDAYNHNNTGALGRQMRVQFHFNPQTSEKKNDALDHEMNAVSEGEVTINHVHNPHTLSFLCSVCRKEFGSGQALGGHMRTHQEVYPQTSEKDNNNGFDYEYTEAFGEQMGIHCQGNPQTSKKKNDAFDHEVDGVAEGDVSLNHVHNPHILLALVPVA